MLTAEILKAKILKIVILIGKKSLPKRIEHLAWWYPTVIPAILLFRRQMQENLWFKVSLGYVGRPCLKKAKQQQQQQQRWVES
jgi:hypothetical protein